MSLGLIYNKFDTLCTSTLVVSWCVEDGLVGEEMVVFLNHCICMFDEPVDKAVDEVLEDDLVDSDWAFKG